MTNWAGIIDSLLLTAGFSLLIGSFILPAILRNMIAMLVNALVSPLASHLPFYLVLMVIAMVISTFSTLVQKYKTDPNLALLLNAKNTLLQKELKEAQLSGNKKKLKKLEEEHTLLLQDQSKVSMQQFKSTGYTVLVSIPLLIWITWYLGTRPSVTMTLPLIGTHAFTDMFLVMPYWALWLTVCTMAFGYVIRKVLINNTA